MFKTILKTAVLSAITITFLSACGAATKALNGAASNAVNLALQDAEKRYLDNIEEIIDENGNTIQVTLDESGKRIQVSTDDNGNHILTSTLAPVVPELDANKFWAVIYKNDRGVRCRLHYCEAYWHNTEGFKYDPPAIFPHLNGNDVTAIYAGKVEANIAGINYANDVEFSVNFDGYRIPSGEIPMGDHTLELTILLNRNRGYRAVNPEIRGSVYMDGSHRASQLIGIIGENKLVGAFTSKKESELDFVGKFSTVRQ